MSGLTERRPWGTYTILDEAEAYKVKRIEVLPKQRLSYQRHKQRAEHWIVVAGQARVTLDGRQLQLSAGETVDIPAEARHRVENPAEEGTLVFIEVQRGTYLGEDDIERFDDDYGRAKP